MGKIYEIIIKHDKLSLLHLNINDTLIFNKATGEMIGIADEVKREVVFYRIFEKEINTLFSDYSKVYISDFVIEKLNYWERK